MDVVVSASELTHNTSLGIAAAAAVAAAVSAGIDGDTDTIAAMAGAVLGAVNGRCIWPQGALAELRRVNDLDLAPVVGDLLALRDTRTQPGEPARD